MHHISHNNLLSGFAAVAEGNALADNDSVARNFAGEQYFKHIFGPTLWPSRSSLVRFATPLNL